MKPFMPKLVYFEPKALEYPLEKELYEKFTKMGLEIRETTSHNQIRNLPGENDLQKYRNAKATLVVGVRKTLKFDTSNPSAEYATATTSLLLFANDTWGVSLTFVCMSILMKYLRRQSNIWMKGHLK